jgi:hypothetical protein
VQPEIVLEEVHGLPERATFSSTSARGITVAEDEQSLIENERTLIEAEVQKRSAIKIVDSHYHPGHSSFDAVREFMLDGSGAVVLLDEDEPAYRDPWEYGRFVMG